MALICLSLCIPSVANAGLITVDETLYQGAASNANMLDGSIDMTLSGSTLTIVLTNTSGALVTEGAGAGNLLTALAFNLPNGVTIGSGTAEITERSASIKFVLAAGDVAFGKEWGFANGMPNAGHWNGTPNMLSYNTVVSALNVDTTSQFLAGSLFNPSHLDGPDGGLAQTVAAAGELDAVATSATFMLTLSGTVPGNPVDLIDASNVGIEFGSPLQSSSNFHVILEPGSLVLFGFGAAVLVGFQFRHRRRLMDVA